MKVDVIMRSKNDLNTIVHSLRELSNQIGLDYELYCFDNASSDGTLDVIKEFTKNVFVIKDMDYIPGKVLNQAMFNSKNEIVVFLNSDCIPTHNTWLLELCLKFNEERVGAVYSKQVPRRNCFPLEKEDLERAFLDEQEDFHFFSMAASAIRREVWLETPFREDLRYSEDIAFTHEIKKKSWKVVFSKKSMVEHSHNYDAFEWFLRQRGEGRAEASIFEWDLWKKSLLRYSVLPYLKSVYRDIHYCLENSYYQSILYSPIYRFAQVLGRRIGFIQGLKGDSYV
ncbi:glycosyltransferase [bacterium]|nr:glycosyltransferase [bacterium]